MTKFLLASLTAAVALASAMPASAALIFDTGAPNGQAVGSYTLNSTSWYAAEVNLPDGSVTDVSTHILGGTAGESFTVALYANDALSNLPNSNELYSATATFGSDGWNGLSNLAGWTVTGGLYWFAFEVRGGQTLGDGGIYSGGLLDNGAANPALRTAFDTTGGLSGYTVTSPTPYSIGLQVSAVPEPASLPMLLAGLGVLGGIARRRKPQA
jgi:hypothetical protein